MSEQWRAVVGYEGWYEVSGLGRVRRIKPARGATVGKILKTPLGTHGYPVANLSRGGRHAVKLRTIHTIVADAFLGAAPTGPERHEINHIDGDKTNPAATNLEWTTTKQNKAHAIRTGLFDPGAGRRNRGSKHPMAKLNEDDVRAIRASPDRPVRDLARTYGVSRDTIYRIRWGQIWKHV